MIVMDDATSALDDEGQTSVLRLLREDLAYATVIAVSHHAALENFFDRKLMLERRPAGSRVLNQTLQQRVSGSLKRFLAAVMGKSR
jgi:vitamin B12/bleomycin/antimicrobial peptide transport system ATP-binding/permease protein